MTLTHSYGETLDPADGKLKRSITFFLAISSAEAETITRLGMWDSFMARGLDRGLGPGYPHVPDAHIKHKPTGILDSQGTLLDRDVTLHDLASGPVTLLIDHDNTGFKNTGRVSVIDADQLEDRVRRLNEHISPPTKEAPPKSAFQPPSIIRNEKAFSRMPFTDTLASSSFSFSWACALCLTKPQDLIQIFSGLSILHLLSLPAIVIVALSFSRLVDIGCRTTTSTSWRFVLQSTILALVFLGFYIVVPSSFRVMATLFLGYWLKTIFTEIFGLGSSVVKFEHDKFVSGPFLFLFLGAVFYAVLRGEMTRNGVSADDPFHVLMSGSSPRFLFLAMGASSVVLFISCLIYALQSKATHGTPLRTTS